MEFFFICAIFAVAVTFAIRGAVRGVKKAYKKRMKDWRKKNKDASDFGLRMAMIGQMLAMFRYGPKAMWSEGREQFRVGWDTGLEWAKKHGYHPDERLDVDEDDLDEDDPDDELDDELDDDYPPYIEPDDWSDPGLVTPAAPPKLRIVKNNKTNQIQPNTRGEPPVAVDVSTPEQMLAALKAIEANALSDRDDAGTAVQRDQDELNNVDAIIAKVTDLKFDPKHIAIVQSLRDPCAAALRAAINRKNAADAKYLAAQRAVKMAEKHRAMQSAGAAGSYYQGG